MGSFVSKKHLWYVWARALAETILFFLLGSLDRQCPGYALGDTLTTFFSTIFIMCTLAETCIHAYGYIQIHRLIDVHNADRDICTSNHVCKHVYFNNWCLLSCHSGSEKSVRDEYFFLLSAGLIFQLKILSFSMSCSPSGWNLLNTLDKVYIPVFDEILH